MYNPKVIQSSMGSFFRVNIIYEDLTNYLSKVKGKIFGSFLNGNEIKTESFPKKFHLVMGNESNGISDEVKSLITEKLTIKNIGKKADSLNVASATSNFTIRDDSLIFLSKIIFPSKSLPFTFTTAISFKLNTRKVKCSK